MVGAWYTKKEGKSHVGRREGPETGNKGKRLAGHMFGLWKRNRVNK